MLSDYEDEFDQVMEDFKVVAGQDFDAAKEVLLKHGIPEEAITKHLMKSLFKNVEAKRCNSCTYVADDLQELRKHIKEKQHNFGQKKLVFEKKDFILRIKTRLKDDSLPDVDLENPQLSPAEIKAFNNFAKDTRLTVGEVSSYHNKLYLCLCCVHINRKIDIPSPANKKAGMKALSKAAKARSPAAATAIEDGVGDVDNLAEEVGRLDL